MSDSQTCKSCLACDRCGRDVQFSKVRGEGGSIFWGRASGLVVAHHGRRCDPDPGPEEKYPYSAPLFWLLEGTPGFGTPPALIAFDIARELQGDATALLRLIEIAALAEQERLRKGAR